MSTTERTLLKAPEEQPENPALRLDDASDRVVCLAGRLIDQDLTDEEIDQEDVADLRAALDDAGDALDEIEERADQ
jgi:hypothetical protein